jgi:hypothetical protein
MILKGTDNKKYNFNYKKGDVVRISGRGMTYPYYTKAMDALQISTDYIDAKSSNEKIKNMNWIITNMIISIHKDNIRFIYSIKNCYGHFLVIDEDGILGSIEIPHINAKKYEEKNNMKDVIVLNEL